MKDTLMNNDEQNYLKHFRDHLLEHTTPMMWLSPKPTEASINMHIAIDGYNMKPEGFKKFVVLKARHNSETGVGSMEFEYHVDV